MRAPLAQSFESEIRDGVTARQDQATKLRKMAKMTHGCIRNFQAAQTQGREAAVALTCSQMNDALIPEGIAPGKIEDL